ncbi:MAG: hydantoinase/oxoprolinase family protein, partial [Chloroflexi bacterium]|nr:hydantoinase/oxoprolinase family protein [Chloroflexota bacterium]
ALGCLVADVRSDFIRTVNLEIDPAHASAASPALCEEYAALERQARRWLADERVDVAESRVVFSADMRFSGQSFETEVTLGGLSVDAADFAEQMLAAFHQRYRALYDVDDLTAAVEVVNVRATAVGVTQKPVLPRLAVAPLSGANVTPSPGSTQQVYVDDEHRSAAVYERSALTWGHRFSGPAVIHQYDSTIFVPPGFVVVVDAYGNLIGELTS